MMFCWHEYTRWTTFESGSKHCRFTRSRTGVYFKQRKQCIKCGKLKIRTVES